MSRVPLNPDSDGKVDAENFCATLLANVDNKKLTAAAFREFVRHTLPIVRFPRPQRPQCELERLGKVAACPCTCLHTTHPVKNHADGCPEKKVK